MPDQNAYKDEDFIPPMGHAGIFIYRNEITGSAINWPVIVNGKNIGPTVGRTHFHLIVKPGTYKIDSQSEKNSTISIEVNEGKNYFIRQEASWWGIVARGILKQVDEEKGRRGVIESKLIARLDFDEEKQIPYTNVDGIRYESEFSENGVPNGKGKIYSPTGHVYEGDIVNGNVSGRGSLKYPDGARYEGDFKNNQILGKGKYVFPDGAYYEGNFKNGKFNGRGVLYSANGSIYEGDFVDGYQTGRGAIKDRKGGRYDGEVKNGEPNGRGVLIIQNVRYEGYFREKKLYSGKIYDQNGIQVAELVNGQQMRETNTNSNASSLQSLGDILVVGLALLITGFAAYHGSVSNPISTWDLINEPTAADIRPHHQPGQQKTRSSASSKEENRNNYELKSTHEPSSHSDGCTSDYSCGVGYTCVKARYSSNGICMTSVDRDGVKTLNVPNSNSIGVRTSEGCHSIADCPAGFECDYTLKACVKR